MSSEVYKEAVRKEYVERPDLQKAFIDFEVVVEAWGDPEVRKAFRGDVKAFLAYKKAENQGSIKL